MGFFLSARVAQRTSMRAIASKSRYAEGVVHAMFHIDPELAYMLTRVALSLLRPLAFLVVLVALGFWIVRPGYWTAKLSRSSGTQAQDEVESIVAELAAENPAASAALALLAEERDIRAAAAAMRHAKNTAGLAGVQDLADRVESHSDYETRLAELALRPALLANERQREEFVWAHATVLQSLQEQGAKGLANDYLARLEHSTSDPAHWRVAKNDAMALLVFEQLAEPNLRTYYQREEEWLNELLLEISALVDDPTNSAGPQANVISVTVNMAETYHPHFKNAVVDDDLGATAFFLFDEFGPLITQAISRGGVPRLEALEVVFANRDFLLQQQPMNTDDQVAALVAVKTQQPAVWEAARQTAFALQLHRDVPQHADLLLDRYGSDDIAAFLYSGYPDDLAAAAAAVALYGDLAVYILNRYTQSEPFRAAIRNAELGPRVIPFVARFGDQGLERLEENRGWLDKHFQADGTPKDEEWWTQIPGGGAVDVARNLAKGYPSEWSELGWAALDTADAVLLVASFGSSSVVTVPAKQGGKAVAKSLGRAETRRAILAAGRARAAKQATRQGTRVAAKAQANSLLRRTITQSGRLAAATGSVASRTWRVATTSGRALSAPIAKLTESARTVREFWLGVSPTVRRIVYRSLLATGLMITLSEKTIPALTEIAESAGGFAGRLAADAAHATAAGLAEAVNQFAQGITGGKGVVPVWLLYVLVLVALLASVWFLRPRFREKLRYVG